MNLKNLLKYFFVLIFCLCSASAFSEQTVDDFALLDYRGNFHQLSKYQDAKAIVLISQGNSCPIVRKLAGYINDIRTTYEPQGVVFLMINSNWQDGRAEIEKEAKEYNISIPILQDSSGTVATALNLTRTAKVIVIDPKNWTILYQGAVHDGLGYEVQKTIKAHYLKDALQSFLTGNEIAIGETPVKGCLINLRNKKVFYEDVVPILQNKCMTCHTPGGGAPWVMDSYDKVVGWGKMMKEVVMIKRMPPWHADPYYRSLEDDLSLTPEETKKLIHWVNEGFPRKSKSDPLANISIPNPSAHNLGRPDLSLQTEKREQVPASGPDEFRFIDLSYKVDQDLWVKAFNLKPSNTKTVHHGNIFVKTPFDKASAANDEKAWFTQSGSSMEEGQMMAGYSPGSGPFIAPKDTGMFIPKGSTLSLWMHYIPTGKPEEDQPTLDIYLYPERPKHILTVEKIANRDIKIPPFTKDYSVSASIEIKNNITLVGLMPHMHYRGKAMAFKAVYPSGKNEILLSVPNYKFRWQRIYTFIEPKVIPKGTRIEVLATFDNSKTNPDNPDPSQTVLYGPRSHDEMMMGLLYYYTN